MKQRNLAEYFWDCITCKYFTLSGRAPRSEFWGFILFSLSLGYAALFIDKMILHFTNWQYLLVGVSSLVTLFLIIPKLCVGIRRFHDLGKPGIIPILLAVVQFIPLVINLTNYIAPAGWLFFNLHTVTTFETQHFSAYQAITATLSFIYFIMATQKGSTKYNYYGPDPLHAEHHNEIEQIGSE